VVLTGCDPGRRASGERDDELDAALDVRAAVEPAPDIAEHLHISVATARTHVGHLPTS
jgi:hypothetical protein